MCIKLNYLSGTKLNKNLGHKIVQQLVLYNISLLYSMIHYVYIFYYAFIVTHKNTVHSLFMGYNIYICSKIYPTLFCSNFFFSLQLRAVQLP